MTWAILALLTAAGIGVTAWAVRRWRDRPPGVTLWWLAGGLMLLLLPVAAVVPSPTPVLVMLLVLVIGLPCAGLVVEWHERRERKAARTSAVSAGVDPREARRRYRRQPRSFATTLALYGVLAMTWMFGSLGVSMAIGTSFIDERAGMQRSSWFLVGMATVVVIGVVHAIVNGMRRDLLPSNQPPRHR